MEILEDTIDCTDFIVYGPFYPDGSVNNAPRQYLQNTPYKFWCILNDMVVQMTSSRHTVPEFAERWFQNAKVQTKR